MCMDNAVVFVAPVILGAYAGSLAVLLGVLLLNWWSNRR